MDGFVYSQRRPLPQGFDEFLAVADPAIVSIDLHQGHLADTPDCPCPAPRAPRDCRKCEPFSRRCS